MAHGPLVSRDLHQNNRKLHRFSGSKISERRFPRCSYFDLGRHTNVTRDMRILPVFRQILTKKQQNYLGDTFYVFSYPLAYEMLNILMYNLLLSVKK